MTSKKYTMNKEDLIKVGKGALIAMASAVVTYGADILTEFDFGQYTVVVVAIVGVLINASRKFLAK